MKKIFILRLWKGGLVMNNSLYIMLYKELDKTLEGTKHVSKNINAIYSNIKMQNKIVAKILFYFIVQGFSAIIFVILSYFLVKILNFLYVIGCKDPKFVTTLFFVSYGIVLFLSFLIFIFKFQDNFELLTDTKVERYKLVNAVFYDKKFHRQVNKVLKKCSHNPVAFISLMFDCKKENNRKNYQNNKFFQLLISFISTVSTILSRIRDIHILLLIIFIFWGILSITYVMFFMIKRYYIDPDNLKKEILEGYISELPLKSWGYNKSK